MFYKAAHNMTALSLPQNFLATNCPTRNCHQYHYIIPMQCMDQLSSKLFSKEWNQFPTDIANWSKQFTILFITKVLLHNLCMNNSLGMLITPWVHQCMQFLIIKRQKQRTVLSVCMYIWLYTYVCTHGYKLNTYIENCPAILHILTSSMGSCL